MPGSVIVSGARTPIGKLNGALASVAPVELGGLAIAEALRRGGVPPEAVDYVIMGQVLQAGQGQNPARQAAVRAGVPMTVPATTVNKVCLSGLNALYLADLMISAGEADVVVAGGMESMSMAPHLLEGARAGIGYGDAALRDEIVVDGLTCSFEPLTMGAATERDAAAANVSRQEQDAVAVRSHDRAAAAIKSGRLGEEIVPVSVPRRRGDPLLVFEDEGVRPGTTPRAAGPPPVGLCRGRRHYRRQRQPDLRWSGRPGHCFPGRGGQPGGEPAGRNRLLRPGGRPRHIAAHSAVKGYCRRRETSWARPR